MKKLSSISLKAVFFCTHPGRCTAKFQLFGILHLGQYLKSASHRWFICLIYSTLPIHPHPQNVTSLSLFRQHHALDTQYGMPNYVSFLRSYNTGWGFDLFITLFTLHQPEQKTQVTTISGRHYSEECRYWWRRIRNSHAAVSPCNSIPQLDAIPQFWLLDWEQHIWEA